MLLSFKSNDGPCLVPALNTIVADFCCLLTAIKLLQPTQEFYGAEIPSYD